MEIKPVDEQRFCDALEVYRASWIESHRRICTPNFLENRDYAGYLRQKMGTLWLISDTVPVGVFSLDGENFGDLYIRHTARAEDTVRPVSALRWRECQDCG